MANVKTRWIASLSNGNTAFEGGKSFELVDGELSPWQKLLEYLKCNPDIKITGMKIQASVDQGPFRTFNLPTMSATPKGNHEKWATLRPIPPIGFNYFRYITQVGVPDGPVNKQIQIRAEYADRFVSLFVDEDSANESWVVVHEKT